MSLDSHVGAAAVLPLFSLIASAQSTWYVDDGGTPPGTGSSADPYTSIQYAISRPATVSGDTIVVRAGYYRETLDLLGKSLDVVGESGAGATMIDAGQAGSVVTYRSGESGGLEGFTLVGGSGTYVDWAGDSAGGGVYCVGASPTIRGCWISGNATLLPPDFSTVLGRGGGVYCGANATLTLIDCEVSDNESTSGGGVHAEGDGLAVLGGSIASNRALVGHDSGRGGGVFLAAGWMNLFDAQVRGNLALGDSSGYYDAYGGGVLIAAGASAAISGCTIEANDAGGFSMGWGDFAGYGGGIASWSTSELVSVVATTLVDNWGNGGGGGFDGAGMLQACTIEHNHGQFGGGVRGSDARLFDCTVRENYGSVSGTYDRGAGVYANSETGVVLERCELVDNWVWGQGGGGHGGTYVDCDIHDNGAYADPSAAPVRGGGVADGRLIGCRVWTNSARELDSEGARGGGISGGSAERCVLYDNEADVGGGAADALLVHCTVVGNRSSASAGGGAVGGDALNSIFWSNLPANMLGTSVSWSDVEGGCAGTGNLALDPLFWDAPSHDYYLRVDSPCVDAGDPTTFDPDGTRADMGAFPLDASHCGQPTAYCTAKTNSLGCQPSISTNGALPSIGAGDFRVIATNVRSSQLGMLFWSRAPNAAPFLGGVACVARPVHRTRPRSSGGSASGNDCTGSYAFEWTSTYLALHALELGDRIYCQFWSRDPGAVDDVGLTAAIEFTLCP